MVSMPKSAALVATLVVSGVVGMTATTRSVQAQSGCQRVHGRIQSNFTTTNCTSPIGLCTVGKITRGGILDSATTFLALDVAPAAGMPADEPAANLAYSGQLTIETKGGTLHIRDLGVLDAVHANFTELERPVSGTGRFTNASNVFFISGALVNNGTGFDGEIYGELCNVGDGDGDGDHDHGW